MRSKKKLISGAIAAGIVLTASVAYADSFQQTAETQQIQAAFVGAQETLLEMGKFSATSEPVTGTTADLTEEECSANIQAYTDKVNLYYSENSRVRQTYIDQYAALINDVYKNKVDYTVDCGVLDCDLNRVSYSDNGNTATIQVTFTVYNKWVGETDSDQFDVAAPINKSQATVVMVKEEGNWKLLETKDWNMGYADDAAEKLQAKAATASNDSELSETVQAIQEAQEICITEYPTFQEALDAANQIDAREINPFALES